MGLLSATHPSYKLFLIVLGAIIAIALASALVGCLTSRIFEVCLPKRKRAQNDVEDASGPLTKTTLSDDSSSSSTPQDGVDVGVGIIAARTGELLAHDTFVGREAEEYGKKIRSIQGLKIARPVPLSDLLKLARRSPSGGDGTRATVSHVC